MNLEIVDIGDKGKGPTYTFYVEGVGRSYIDHCIVSSNIEQNVIHSTVLEDSIENTSDHLALITDIKLPIKRVNIIQPTPRVAWRKLCQNEISTKYTEPLQHVLSQILDKYRQNDQTDTREKLDNVVKECVDAMLDVSKNNMPMTKFDKMLKPYWNDELNVLSKQEKKCMWEWRQCGRPRSSDNPVYMRYKESKKVYRREQRKAELAYERKAIEELESTGEVDQKAFWFIINKMKGKMSKNVRPVRDEKGSLLVDETEIRNEWRNYFHGLFTPKECENYDNDHKTNIENEIQRMKTEECEREPMILRDEYKVEDIEKLCKSIKLGKAPGWDLVDPEHWRYGGPMAWQLLTLIVNRINDLELIPTHMKKGILIPIEKPGSDSSYKDKNRGITIGPMIGKLYERLLMTRFEPWCREKGIINAVQGANQLHCSSIHTGWLVRETISYNIERGSSVWAAMLDIKKAFDTVWIDGLLYRLFHTGMDKKLWNIIYDMYTDAKCSVLIGGERSDWFTVGQGVHQGAPLSMLLFIIYIDPLLVELKQSNVGAHIADHNITCPAFADDVALLALTEKIFRNWLTLPLYIAINGDSPLMQKRATTWFLERGQSTKA